MEKKRRRRRFGKEDDNKSEMGGAKVFEDEEVKKIHSEKIRFFDWGLLFIVVLLIGLGLVTLYSVSSYNAMLKFQDSAFYVKNQAKNMVIGIVFLVIFSLVDYHRWYRLSGIIYVGAIVLNIFVIFAGSTFGGSTRWLKIGPISFQPSETMKFAIILFLSAILSRIPSQMGKTRAIFTVFLMSAPGFILVAKSNLSTAVIILGITFVMVFVSSPRFAPFFGLSLAAAGGAMIFLLAFSYRVERIKIWLHPEDYDKGYQTLQGLYAIGSGGIFGKGLGQSIQKLGFVPEPENDMIFSIICEEMGLVGAICVILLFMLLLYRLLLIANNASDMFGSFISIGVMAHVFWQVFLNVGVVTNLFPNTGVTLPFISYGGTSCIFLLMEIGFCLSVSRGIRLESLEKKPKKEIVPEKFKELGKGATQKLRGIGRG